MNKTKKPPKKVVLITGITGGIGQSTAYLFAQEGWDIIGQYCSSRKASEDLKKELIKFDVDVDMYKVDLLSQSQTNTFLKRVKKRKVDALVNNAGSLICKKTYGKLDWRFLQGSFALNITAPTLLTQAVFPFMRKQKSGHIVNVSSIAAKYGGSMTSLAYGCSKRALEGLTKTLASEGARSNILVNTVRPGVIDTNFHKKFPKDMNRRAKLVPLRRLGVAEEVARVIYFLVAGNTYITNETITVAGGE